MIDIISYLSYLRDISRKIISRNGFEKAIIDRSKNDKAYALQVHSVDSAFSSKSLLYNELKNISRYLNTDKKLFCGFGLICGEDKSKKYAAPLLFIECAIEYDSSNEISLFEETNDYDNKNDLHIEYNLETLTLNYDLLSRLLSADFSSEDDDENISFNDEIQIIEEIEKEIESLSNVSSLKQFSDRIFQILHKRLEKFQKIKLLDSSLYSYKKENEKYNNRKKTEKSIFESDLKYVSVIHYFVNKIPDKLSTFEALRKLIKEIKKNDFKNQVLKKLLLNALTEERVEINIDDHYPAIQKIITNSLPIKLSHNQIQALQNAWNRDISYIQGPPGTGKSYTISAIALSAIFLGKKVLVISQKIPALNVVRNFIEPFLKFDTRLQGIMYYDHNLRKNIKDHINHLLSLSGERELRNNIKFIQSQLSEKENRLEKILKDISEITIALKNNLEDEKNYKTINQEFQKLKKDFSNYYNYRINSDFAFIICREQEKKRYEKLAEKYNCIFSHQCRTLSSKLFLLKYKEFLKKIFNVNINNIDDSILPDFSKHIFEINFTLTKLNEKYNRLKKTNELLRKRIENNEKEVLLLKEEILKLRHKLSIFTLLDSRNHIEALQKFKSLLHFRNTSIIADKISDIDYIKILEIMPFWVAEIRHLNQLFPMKHDLFDIVIVDESSQVNLAEVIPAFYRGKQICVVGDDKQLGLDSTGVNFQLNKTFDMFIWSKYFKNTTLIYETGKAKKLTVSDSSILDFLINEFNNIHPSRVMLDEHFRSMPLLANYTNSRFYNNELKIMTETGDKIFTNSFITFKVNGERDHNKIILKEAERIISIIKEITSNANDNTALFIEEQIIKLPESIKKPFSIGIISMIRNQCDFISDLLEEKINDTIINEYDIMVGTPEEFQGHEKDIMIFSLCLDRNCSRGTQFFQNDKRLNVATSRAKKLMIFVYSEIPNNFTKIIDCVKYFGINPEIVEPNNKAVYPEYNPLSWKLNFDKYESEFEKQVYFYLKEYAEHKSKNGEIQIFNQVKSCGQKRLDFVVYNSKTNKFVAIEVDGSSHFLDDGFRYSEKHIERIEILKRAGWNIINTPYYLWYKNGWLADKNDNNYKRELERIYSIIDSNIL